ncbi:MAG: hypothetical protein HeimC2_36280 [Candidatus Heimdallarchaeota archaeon LC_2]|nr:MAG: hypothetical protein HeimC2_36280 [Candidatus Heimdallarchaeota archaeon LC_2]
MNDDPSSDEFVDLWVCPNCEVLMGIETRLEKDKIYSNCLNCGTDLPISEVSFLSQALVKSLNVEVLDLFPTYIHEDIRFSWVSNKTLGLIFSIPQAELIDEIDFDMEEIIEEKLSKKYDMNITIYFE